MAFRGSLRRLFVCLSLALVLAGVIHRANVVVVKNPICTALDPTENPWLWWWYDCGDESAGGGGGGAK